MKKEIAEKLKNIIRNFVSHEEGDLDADVSLEKLGINSISLIKIIIQIENEFDIEFDQKDLQKQRFETLANIILYIENRIVNKG